MIKFFILLISRSQNEITHLKSIEQIKSNKDVYKRAASKALANKYVVQHILSPPQT